METQLTKLKRFMAEGDYHSALRMAAKFGQLGTQRDAITLGWAAKTNPRFYRELGKDPDQLVQNGIKAIRERYELV